MRDSLEVYANENENEVKLPEAFLRYFPESIKISQTAAAWAVLAQKPCNRYTD